MKAFVLGAVSHILTIALMVGMFVSCLYMADVTFDWWGGDKLWHWIAWTAFGFGLIGGTQELIKKWTDEADERIER
jgi:hypothetical protein